MPDCARSKLAGRWALERKHRRRSLRLQRRRYLSTAIKIRIIIISVTVKWSMRTHREWSGCGILSHRNMTFLSCYASSSSSSLFSSLCLFPFSCSLRRSLIPFPMPAATTQPSMERCYPRSIPQSRDFINKYRNKFICPLIRFAIFQHDDTQLV